MTDKRFEPRLLCAELVEVTWRDKSGTLRRRIANLEDISLSGACLQMEAPLHRGAAITLRYGKGELSGTARYCLCRDFGYYIGVEFAAGCKWSTQNFRPKHLLDPRRLTERSLRRASTGRDHISIM